MALYPKSNAMQNHAMDRSMETMVSCFWSLKFLNIKIADNGRIVPKTATAKKYQVCWNHPEGASPVGMPS